MFKIFRQHSVNRINIVAILFVGIFAALSAFVVIFNEFREFKKEIIAVEKNYTLGQKREVVEQSSRLYRLIEYRYKNHKLENQDGLYHSIAKEVGIVLSGSGAGDYIFIYDKNRQIVYSSKQFKHNKSTVDKLFREAKEAGVLLKFDVEQDGVLMENIVFVREFERLGWVIGSGVCTSQKEVVLAKKSQEHRDKIAEFILKIVTLTLFLYLATILQYRYIAEKLGKEIKFIVESLKSASTNYTSIDRGKIKFQEFKEITMQVNSMLLELKEKKSDLEEMNLNLESLVQEKTKELQKSVAFVSELLESQDRFLKNAIHEINTPLSVILMNLDLHNLKFNKNRYLINIEAAVKVLGNIYSDLSFVVQKDTKTKRVDMINFSNFLRARIEYFKDVAIANGLKLKSEIQSDISILFSEFELQRLCDNNISNAIKYSHIDRDVSVNLYEDEEYVVFEVQNFGEKIESTSRVFQRYYREDKARGGFGLGLNIVKEICDNNTIRVEVKSDEKRTVFQYYFKKGNLS